MNFLKLIPKKLFDVVVANAISGTIIGVAYFFRDYPPFIFKPIFIATIAGDIVSCFYLFKR
jgi:hypothetical protein